MAKRDYYETLGVDRTVSEGDLKKAFRRLAMKYHPDRNTEDPEAEQRFNKPKAAYEILSDPQKRSAYDQFGHAGVDPSSGMGGGGGAGGFGDIFMYKCGFVSTRSFLAAATISIAKCP